MNNVKTGKKTILIVEDDEDIQQLVGFNLIKAGFLVEYADSGEQALDKINKNQYPDLILLDIMLPGMDGIEVCKALRIENQTAEIPVIMLTAKEEEVDKVLGLELGADDYITKPFGMRELIARVKANLRRIDMDGTVEAGEVSVIESGNLSIDLDRYEVSKESTIIELTLREFELLKYLATQENQIFSREQLLKDVWGYEYFGDIRTVDVTVRRLREKIEDDSSSPKYILTKRGVGYYFRRT